MPPRSNSTYRAELTRNTNRFSCPDCAIVLLPKEYESHCQTIHHINSKTTCVWCRQVSWPNRQKNKHYFHLKICMRQFLLPLSSIPDEDPSGDNGGSSGGSGSNSSETTPVLMNLKHIYRPKTFYGGIDNLPTDEVYDDPSPFLTTQDDAMPFAKPSIDFPDADLNTAATLVCTFIQYRNRYRWYHIMVKPMAFRSFLSALNEHKTTVRTIPFSCWCNGGHYPERKHRQHRHMIVVCVHQHFKKFWPKVKPGKEEVKPSPHFPCKRSKQIEFPVHLINAMGYLSHRKSTCDFSFDDNSNTRYKMHHFYLYRTLPEYFRLPLAVLFVGGLRDCMYKHQFQNASIPKIAHQPMTIENSKYVQKIKHFYGHKRGQVLPVSKDFIPVKQVTPHVFNLLKGKKIYFQRDPQNETLDDATWLRRQVEGGNCFYDNVEEEVWIPRPYFQGILSYYKPVLDENKMLKSDNNTLKSDINTLKSKNEILQEKLTTCKRKHEETETKHDEIERKLVAKQRKIEQLYDENKQLLVQKIAKLEKENEQLKMLIEQHIPPRKTV